MENEEIRNLEEEEMFSSEIPTAEELEARLDKFLEGTKTDWESPVVKEILLRWSRKDEGFRLEF